MKVTFEFNLPDDDEDYLLYQQAPKTREALTRLRDCLRNAVKYLEGEDRPTLSQVYEEYFEICRDQGIDPWGE